MFAAGTIYWKADEGGRILWTTGNIEITGP